MITVIAAPARAAAMIAVIPVGQSWRHTHSRQAGSQRALSSICLVLMGLPFQILP